jgi:hypothetical protein
MTDNTVLTDLLARVEGARGPDRELDRDLAEALYPELLTRERRVIQNDEFAWLLPAYGITRCERYTASLDAALALVSRALPEANCLGVELVVDKWDGYVSRNNVQSGHWLCEANGKKTAPVAILAALLKALIARSAP